MQFDIPGYVTGAWVIDTDRSDVSFEVRQMGVFTVRGSFDDIEGTIVTMENPRDSSVSAVIRTASVNTRNDRRDKHLRTGDFLDVERYPTMTFTSTGVRPNGHNVLVDGDLAIRGATKQVTLNMEVNSFGLGHDGRPLARFSARTEISRNGYGVVRGPAAAVVSKTVKIILRIEATRQD
ncbi:MAG TPA: YceI family protein [Micromonosporaceae bacterium]|nr:YceI family protein [Micromonosporaceae bacterium]